jgi:hypothetical protein
MPKTITFGEAIARFENLVTTDIDIRDALQEAIESIYEEGRWPGTTEEIELTDDLFVDLNNGWTVLELNDLKYAGAVGFRTDFGGWQIRHHEVLYKEGVNAGDKDFIDLGTEDRSGGTRVRRYKCPDGFRYDSTLKHYALMKLDPPDFADDDILPIESIRAIKAAIKSICYEYVDDEINADLQWKKFEIAMLKSTAQVDGPKKQYIGIDSSLRRKPKQFM